MGQVHVRVVLTNHREAVMAQFGQLDANRVHHYETEALIDTGATRSVIPSAVADRLGLFRIRRTDAQYADSVLPGPAPRRARLPRSTYAAHRHPSIPP